MNWKVLASFVIIAIAWFGSLEFEKSSSSSGSGSGSGGNTKTKLDEKKSSSSLMMVSEHVMYIHDVLVSSWDLTGTNNLTDIMLVPILSLSLIYKPC